MAMLARRKGLTLATDYLIALRRSSQRPAFPNGMVEEGLKKTGLERSAELGLGVESLLGIGARRGISGVARWVGEGSLGEKHQQGLALLGRRNFNLLSLRDQFKGATAKAKNTVMAKGAGSSRAPESVWKPVNTAKKTVIGYREALGLQLEAFWKRNYLAVVGAVGLGVCLLLWRIMFGIASMFVNLSEGMAKFGFLALAAAMVTVGGIWLRSRVTIKPDAVYRIAMRKLNTSAPVLEAMGAPLRGTDLRAYIMSGGDLRIKSFRPRLSNKRCFIIFPVSGAERKGLVSIEVKKKGGQYDFKLLAVDIPTIGADHRVYLIGDENEYRVGGGLISDLRDPIVKAMAAQKEFEERDEKEEQDDLRREWEHKQASERERIEKQEREAAAAEQAATEQAVKDAADEELKKSQEAERLRQEAMKA
ncbi:uncharacterized protein [Physcomitrium patens]|uniref:Uncharacterized protein n=1 Tax=Physcomitrium patens TaxID=3218 RepID=A0A2K1L6Y9_PHYPA|nr:uncharacterized protein LOC112291616 [Physcomitrium patens]XP_024395064.1 uncharacterized protein LOC112291616 [Physcomitrium patens]XP_024395072.1 uncharacterized protein LOC112291616 [Physcomitrium patens]PNR61793.1 hypothetical protein PHYPA_000217 [Physcomitrium patens]|eukprot:XP_024395053.1 uncharacterized protein LOC112291616 [Physcomitrella patens]